MLSNIIRQRQIEQRTEMVRAVVDASRRPEMDSALSGSR